jgi:hypothetical protein
MESVEPARLRWSTGLSGDTSQGDMSQASITAQFPADGRGVNIQLQWSGTPTGTFSFKGSNRHNPNSPTETKWTTIDSSLFSPAITNPAGSASDWAAILSDHGFDWIQVIYTRTGSSGTLIGDAKSRIS